jgi:hypothetical protein
MTSRQEIRKLVDEVKGTKDHGKRTGLRAKADRLLKEAEMGGPQERINLISQEDKLKEREAFAAYRAKTFATYTESPMGRSAALELIASLKKFRFAHFNINRISDGVDFAVYNRGLDDLSNVKSWSFRRLGYQMGLTFSNWEECADSLATEFHINPDL